MDPAEDDAGDREAFVMRINRNFWGEMADEASRCE